jgi:hypothetical protein
MSLRILFSIIKKNIANTYTRDSHIVAYKANVNAEMLSLEKQINSLNTDNPKRIEYENHLGILKRY